MSMVLFNQGQLPAHIIAAAAASNTNKALAGGIGGGDSFLRIATKNGRFWMRQGKTELHSTGEPIDVTILAAQPAVGRIFYAKDYDGDAIAPSCASDDGARPSKEIKSPVSKTCDICPNNIAGSGKNGTGRACGYVKRLVVALSDELEGTNEARVFVLDTKSMSIFGKGDGKSLLTLNELSNKLREPKAGMPNGTPVETLRTTVQFDHNSTVPKLFFTPIAYLSEHGVVRATELMGLDSTKKLVTMSVSAPVEGEEAVEAANKVREAVVKASMPMPTPVATPVATPVPTPKRAKPPTKTKLKHPLLDRPEIDAAWLEWANDPETSVDEIDVELRANFPEFFSPVVVATPAPASVGKTPMVSSKAATDLASKITSFGEVDN